MSSLSPLGKRKDEFESRMQDWEDKVAVKCSRLWREEQHSYAAEDFEAQIKRQKEIREKVEAEIPLDDGTKKIMELCREMAMTKDKMVTLERMLENMIEGDTAPDAFAGEEDGGEEDSGEKDEEMPKSVGTKGLVPFTTSGHATEVANAPAMKPAIDFVRSNFQVTDASSCIVDSDIALYVKDKQPSLLDIIKKGDVKFDKEELKFTGKKVVGVTKKFRDNLAALMLQAFPECNPHKNEGSNKQWLHCVSLGVDRTADKKGKTRPGGVCFFGLRKA